jgi:Family of unknown function (DUF6292)
VTTELPQAAHTNHQPYIETVRVALLLKDIQIGAAVFTGGRVRSASMPLTAPEDDADDPWHPTFAAALSVRLRWSEEAGWALLALHTSGDTTVPAIWRRGFGVVLPPDEVASWVALLLTMPIAVGSREDGPYRSHQQHDPALEASLSAFAG